MGESKDEILIILTEIQDLLKRIYLCFEDEYIKIQEKKYSEKITIFEAMLTDTRRKIFPLLFDERHLSQREISQIVGISQPAVSKFVNLLIENGLVEKYEENNEIFYRDRYDLTKISSSIQ